MGGSAAETPTSPDGQPVPGLRASDAEREQVASRLRDEFVEGRLSHDTFLHRMSAAFESRRQADLPPLLADLPARSPERSLIGRLRGTWSRVTSAAAPASRGRAALPGGEAASGRATGPRAVSPSPVPGRSLTAGFRSSPDRPLPVPLQFPRGTGSQFSIGRDTSCDLAIADMTVSRRHAALERTADGWLLSDLESTNGTRVNGWLVRGKVPVRVGDLVSFGNLLCYLQDDAVLSVRGCGKDHGISIPGDSLEF